MSLEKKSVHVKLTEDAHKRLSVLADFNESDMAEHAAYLLEKALAGEWYAFSVHLKKISKLGLTGSEGE
jgi:hypothetical protein